jgi:single-strand DNA-binding protein
MRSVNKVILVGHIGQDPEIRYTASQTPVCNFRLATNEGYKDSDGNFVEKTEWHTVVAWARLAEIVNEYMRKGQQVYVEGTLQTRTWEDREGNTRYTTEVKARDIIMLGGRGGNGGFEGSSGGYGTETGVSSTPSKAPSKAPSANGNGGASNDPFDVDDDLPF